MKKIDSLFELKQERKRLLLKEAELELLLKSDLHELKEEFEPSRILVKTANKLVTSKEEGILGYSLGSLTHFIVKKTLLRNSGFLTKFTLGYVVRNVASHFFSANKGTILNWVSSALQKRKTTPKVAATENSFSNQEY